MHRSESEPVATQHAPNKSILLVGLANGGVRRDEVGLDLRRHNSQSFPACSHDVDRTALAVLRIRHLHEYLPAERPQPANRLRNQGRMVLIEKSVDFAAAPAHVGLPARIDRCEQTPHGVAGELRAVPALDERYRLLREAGLLAERRLRQEQTSSKRPEYSTDSHVVHRSIVTTRTYLTLISGLPTGGVQTSPRPAGRMVGPDVHAQRTQRWASAARKLDDTTTRVGKRDSDSEAPGPERADLARRRPGDREVGEDLADDRRELEAVP
jgi:hypothetical protein